VIGTDVVRWVHTPNNIKVYKKKNSTRKDKKKEE